MEKAKISDNVIRRLPRYIRQVDMLIDSGVTRASSGKIGKLMGLTASQIRQDFNYFGGFGQPGYGYNLPQLRQQLAEILGANANHSAVLIGAGNLGRALMRNFHFSECGFRLAAAFDVQTDDEESLKYGIPVYSMDFLEEYLQKNGADVAVLTVPGTAANELAKKLAALNVRGIWNFTNTELRSLPANVIVENVHFSDSLMALNYYLTEKKTETPPEGRND